MIILSVLQETNGVERRVAITPDAIKKLLSLDIKVHVQTSAGIASGISDEAYSKAGAEIKTTAAESIAGTQILLTVSTPPLDIIKQLPSGAVVVGMLSPHANKELIAECASQNITAFAMELLPRTSRAQAMDVLSSQGNLAGYRAVIDAVATLGKATPMLMTAAGTIPPAKVLVLGAGVAGLQAIATAKRLGCVVYAFDVRPAVKEQVESLGARFVEVPLEADAETAGGYAKEMSENYKKKQSALIHETLTKMDAAISTALIPGKPAPVLITEEMVKDMKPGSVIVDLAVASGGNCPLSKPDEVITAYGVTIIGYTNMPSRIAADATPLYARNLYNFVATLFNKEKQLVINLEDDLVKATMLTHNGAVLYPASK
jgi:NAD(P) transhydrogenase subunit alpha